MPERPLNILLVEDDEVDVMNVRRAFERGHMKHSLFVAGNAVRSFTMETSSLTFGRRQSVWPPSERAPQ